MAQHLSRAGAKPSQRLVAKSPYSPMHLARGLGNRETVTFAARTTRNSNIERTTDVTDEGEANTSVAVFRTRAARGQVLISRLPLAATSTTHDVHHFARGVKRTPHNSWVLLAFTSTSQPPYACLCPLHLRARGVRIQSTATVSSAPSPPHNGRRDAHGRVAKIARVLEQRKGRCGARRGANAVG